MSVQHYSICCLLPTRQLSEGHQSVRGTQVGGRESWKEEKAWLGDGEGREVGGGEEREEERRGLGRGGEEMGGRVRGRGEEGRGEE